MFAVLQVLSEVQVKSKWCKFEEENIQVLNVQKYSDVKFHKLMLQGFFQRDGGDKFDEKNEPFTLKCWMLNIYSLDVKRLGWRWKLFDQICIHNKWEKREIWSARPLPFFWRNISGVWFVRPSANSLHQSSLPIWDFFYLLFATKKALSKAIGWGSVGPLALFTIWYTVY